VLISYYRRRRQQNVGGGGAQLYHSVTAVTALCNFLNQLQDQNYNGTKCVSVITTKAII